MRSRTPGVMSLKQALTAWLSFQIEVLVRRSQVRIGKIDDRLELLDGFLIAYLNLDRVIEIIRSEDEPKPMLMAEFSLTDRQAEAILNMRLRSLRKLEEMEIGRERNALAKEREELVRLVESPPRQRTRLKRDLQTLKDKFGDDRRTRIEEVAATREIDWSAMIEKEPITVILSQRGWIRAMKGHIALEEVPELKWREGDGPFIHFHAQTTDKIALFASNGRVYTLAGDKLPGARGFGEPVRLFIDLEAEVDIVQLLVVRPDLKLLIASSDGKGFVTSGDATLAETRKGKQLVNLRTGARVAVIRPMPEGADAVAVDRREPQDDRFPTVRTSRTGARPGRDAAALSRRRPVGRGHFRARGWTELGARRRKRARSHRNGPDALAGRSRRGGADAADRFPARQKFRLALRKRLTTRSERSSETEN